MKPFVPALAVCVTAAMLAACGQKAEQPSEPATAVAPPPAPAPAATLAPAAGASVQLAATQGHSVTGALTVTPEAEGLRLSGTLQGLPPSGEFGFHIHELGDCSAPDASSAGPHFNPTNKQHGNPEGGAHHVGDLYNVKSDGQGVANVNALAPGVTLGDGQANDVAGKAVVVHEKPDDYTSQPAGNSGDRIACGVITAG